VVKPPASILPETRTPAPTRPAAPITTEAGQHALVDRVSLYLSTIQTLVGNFVQVGPDGRKTEGKFYIQKPGKVKFEYDPPSPIDVVADGSFVQVRDRKLDTKDTYPLATTPLRYLLADRIDLWRETHLVSVGQDDKYVTITIEERSLVVGTHRLMMMFDAKDFQLLQWTVTDPQGYDTTVGVYNLDTNKKPDPNLFRISYGPFDQRVQ
jgi:outer membrane lipoprotein-sorting protein